MADTASSIFNKKATDKLRNPDDLDKVIQVTNPSVWVALAACIALLAGLLAWGIFGAVTTSVSTKGVVVNGEALCFLSSDDVTNVTVDDIANFGGAQVTVSTVDAIPASKDEMVQILGSDYLVTALTKDDWGYRVVFSGDVSEVPQNVPVNLTITVDRVSPISLILNNWG